MSLVNTEGDTSLIGMVAYSLFEPCGTTPSFMNATTVPSAYSSPMTNLHMHQGQIPEGSNTAIGFNHSDGSAMIQLFDLSGRLLFESKDNAEHSGLSIFDSLPSGIYLKRVLSNNGMDVTNQFIVHTR